MSVITKSVTHPESFDVILRPLGITHNVKAYRILCSCIQRICLQEDRLEAVQKEIYEPLAEEYHCSWVAIQSAVRRASRVAWEVNPSFLQELAGYPLHNCPTPVQFLEILAMAASSRGVDLS